MQPPFLPPASRIAVSAIYIFLHMRYSASGGDAMTEFLMLIGFLAFWVALQKYILPRLGVQT
jgi:hypothetical protein